MDNSELRIKAAWREKRKREQGRSVPPPALLALQGGFGGADLEDFENALFGRDIWLGHRPEGVLATDANPPWSGVLAFLRVSSAGADDPVLFLSPHYNGPLPDAMARLEVRRLESGGVNVQPARDVNVMVGMRWAARID